MNQCDFATIFSSHFFPIICQEEFAAKPDSSSAKKNIDFDFEQWSVISYGHINNPTEWIQEDPRLLLSQTWGWIMLLAV